MQRKYCTLVGSKMQAKTKYKLNIWLSVIVSLAYVLIPTDISPDMIPVAGWIDDAVVVLIAVGNAIHFAMKLKKKN